MEDDEEAAALVKVLRFLVHQRFTGVWVVTPIFFRFYSVETDRYLASRLQDLILIFSKVLRFRFFLLKF